MTPLRLWPRPFQGHVRRVWGVRGRATATAVTVVALALVAGGLLLLLLLQSSLIATSESTAKNKAADVAALIASQDVSEAGQSLADTARSGQYVQIINPQGAVVASSERSTATTPLSDLRPGPGETKTDSVSSLQSIEDTDEFLIVASGVQTDAGTYTVIVASTVQVQADSVSTVAWFLLGATPLLLVVVGFAVWFLVGRSLRQVERIRGQVDHIDASRLGERVEVPATNDEIHRLALTMNTMLEKLQASDGEQRRFVSDASHELRSPLATISAGLEIAAADPSGYTWRELQGMLSGETARMRYLVDDLLTLAKANDGGIHIIARDVDLDDVLAAEIRRLRPLSPHAISASLVPARVTGDAQRLGQVLRNVLENANRHAKSSIAIELASGSDGVVVVIDNDGDPVPAADRERIFERFVRLDESRSRESGGSGLGLAIAAGIMSAHHGTITATQAPSGNCRFELHLPSGNGQPIPGLR
ncbi:HAMP domain-containing sensor histidine kinase [Arthrobacter sp. H35-D1]|uniref:sensor histidine kinase n=1 Tax=Arthrobacter sp. H35-D1 TaxID=3046202 RepID=UPI0024B8B17A|nr:HAMP domain-containing sensor histidine kinase [Arthrobacter sp. H35-D1]MDJ0313860.1 HAMP domain-containing sensor histidine kinase [Arthrobacter sp. H35-D1]